MSGFARLCFGIACLVAASAATAAPASVEFDGNTLQRLRSGNAGLDHFTEYGRKTGDVAETLTIRFVTSKAPFKAQVGDLVKSIKAKNPGVKLKVMERPNTQDVLISYLADRPNSNVSLMLWRMTASGESVLATIYQMDFDIGDEDAKERVTGHTAERTLAGFDAAKIRDLVSGTP